MPPQSLTNFEIQLYNRGECQINNVYWRNNSQKNTKDESYVICSNCYAIIGTYFAAAYVRNEKVIYFNGNISKKIKKLLGSWYVIGNSFRIKSFVLIMCGYFWTDIIDLVE